MRTHDDRTPIEILRDMSDHEVLLATMVVLPAVLALWAYVLSVIIPGHAWYWCVARFILLVIVGPLVYYQGIINLRKNETDQERLQRERKILIARLKPRKNHSASIEKMAVIDTESSRQLTAQIIEELITAFPGYFASTTMKSKSPSIPGKPGVKLLGDEEESPDQKSQESPESEQPPSA